MEHTLDLGWMLLLPNLLQSRNEWFQPLHFLDYWWEKKKGKREIKNIIKYWEKSSKYTYFFNIISQLINDIFLKKSKWDILLPADYLPNTKYVREDIAKKYTQVQQR